MMNQDRRGMALVASILDARGGGFIIHRLSTSLVVASQPVHRSLALVDVHTKRFWDEGNLQYLQYFIAYCVENRNHV